MTAITTSSTATIASAAIGYLSARNPSPTTNTSSPTLRNQFENGSGLALATTRVPAFVKCVLAATVPPSSATIVSTAGDASPSAVSAISAPPSGRMKVCSVSQAESIQGILSAKNSMT